MRRRRITPRWLPWTPEEDATLRQLTNCGATSFLWRSALPQRTFGEVAERRLQMIEAGDLVMPDPI